MEYALVGWSEDEPRIRLDHREFSYAGKFVMSNTGNAVARDPETVESERERDPESDGGTDTDWLEDDRIVAAIAFNEDRTDSATAWLRYVTVRRDRRGEGIGARLAGFATARLRERGYDRVQIAVNNAFAYHALYKAGFGYTGDQTGLAELVLAAPADRTAEGYQSGLDAYREREDLTTAERDFLAAKADTDPPDVIRTPE
ncbi:GNAT family N-acetyltransferase [Halorussus caseinilyticus]|uniref:GNAT family N-acetyltransferase n=1 Tax=Halorussus caseinilyticus TaxID=3034025 RepID=UPI0023E84C00|nr:GNAT family N-acetyltransferase [Halorussus sp. DT72]